VPSGIRPNQQRDGLALRRLSARPETELGMPSPFPHRWFTCRFRPAGGWCPVGKRSRRKLSLRGFDGGWWGGEVITVAAYRWRRKTQWRRCKVLPTSPSYCTSMRWTWGNCQAKPVVMSSMEASSHQRMADGGAKLRRGGQRRWARAVQVGAKGPADLGLSLGRGNQERVAYNASYMIASGGGREARWWWGMGMRKGIFPLGQPPLIAAQGGGSWRARWWEWWVGKWKRHRGLDAVSAV
jgi:hypothetical protein